MSQLKSYPPSDQFVAAANIKTRQERDAMYARAQDDPSAFWGTLAEKELSWFQPFTRTLDWQPPFVKWFSGGKINASYNCLDRHLTTDRKDKPALIFEGEPGDERIITYVELHRLVCRLATTLKNLDYKSGDRAVIYMPMIPELAIALLACARLGITHSVVFRGLFGGVIEGPNA